MLRAKLHRARMVLLALGAVAAISAADARAVWLEGEKPTRANVKFRAAGWGRPEILSEGKWLHLSISADEAAKGLPKGGALLEYDFSVARAGRHEVWNRIGLEFARSPFEWRRDAGAWRTVTPRELTCDLMELDFWCEVAWLRLGAANWARASTRSRSASPGRSRRSRRGRRAPTARRSRSSRRSPTGSATPPTPCASTRASFARTAGSSPARRGRATTTARPPGRSSRSGPARGRSSASPRRSRASGRSAATTSRRWLAAPGRPGRCPTRPRRTGWPSPCRATSTPSRAT